MRRVASILVLLLGVTPARSAVAQEYRVLKTEKIGGEGGWDYLTVDAAARRLYLSRGTRAVVLDADTLKLIGEIPDTPGIHGVAVAADLGKGFTSNGRAGNSTIFDLKTLKPLGQVKTGDNPDAIFYDKVTQRIFTFNGRSSDATAIDAKAGTIVGTIPLGGKPEAAVTDGKGRIFVNLEDKAEVVAFDPKDLSVKAHWSLAPCEEPTGLAIDVANKRLFAACHNKLMTVMDFESGKVVTTVPIGPGTDGAAFDPERKLAFSSNGGDGTLTVVRELSADKFEVAQNVPTMRGARTIAFDPKTHNVYVVTAEFGPTPAATPEQPRPRPSMVPDSFTVLVIGR
jgi:DNA-binding beta-propeller fold protein YncE